MWYPILIVFFVGGGGRLWEEGNRWFFPGGEGAKFFPDSIFVSFSPYFEVNPPPLPSTSNPEPAQPLIG